MSGIVKYKGYEGTTEIDMERGVCRGRILFISDLITYESETPKGLQAEFEAAVDDYLETCAEIGREAQQPFSGQFNVRVAPEVHKDARLRSIQDNTSLNDVVVRALNCYLYGKGEVTNNHYVLVGSEQLGNKLLVAAVSADSEFGVTASVRTH